MEQKLVDALKWVTSILDAHNITYQITGGFAASLYGSPRPVNDIDIDIPDNCIQKILSDISAFITYGPAHFNDGKWDMELVTLDYKGQEIDIGEIGTLRISNKERTRWLPYPHELEKAIPIEVAGLRVLVQHPRDLARYKKELDGDHQKIDIDAAEKYAEGHRL